MCVSIDVLCEDVVVIFLSPIVPTEAVSCYLRAIEIYTDMVGHSNIIILANRKI